MKSYLLDYQNAEVELDVAISKLQSARMCLESQVLHALGLEHAPLSDMDPVCVVCGETLITLLPSDRRPMLRTETIVVVEG